MEGPFELYQAYRERGLSHFNDLVNNDVETSIQEFKTFTSTNPTSWGQDDKRSISEAISGFANSEGGVLVWGVDCRKDTQGIDKVQALKPISKLSAVHSQMLLLATQLVSPAVQGIQSFTVEKKSGSDKGYIVMLVPRGESFPHMAMTGHKFMYRAGSSFLPMPQWLVADRFGRRPQPKLQLVWKRGSESKVDLFIENVGLGLARYLAFELQHGSGFNLRRFEGSTLEPELRWTIAQNHVAARADGNLVIHPKRNLYIGRFDQGIDDAEIDYEIFCEGFSDKGQLVIPS